MSAADNWGTGGESDIPTPSARPSIHNHPFCPFAYAEAMVGYGLNNRRKASSQLRANQSNNINGLDEVDNVFSKPSQPLGPLFTHLKNNRRNSLERHDQIEQLQDDCDSDSDGENYRSDGSYYSSNPGSSPTNRSRPESETSSPVNNQTFNGRTHRSDLDRSGSITSKSYLPIIMLVSVASVLYLSVLNTSKELNKVVYDEARFYKDIDSLGNKYNIDANSLLRLQTGIATIFEKEDVGSFVFVYNSKDNISPSDFDNFINDVYVTTSKYLRNESTQVHHTSIDGATLDVSGLLDHGELMCRYKPDLSRSGVMLVRQVHAVPSNLAMAFHYYCDEYNPLVKRSAIFFTLDIAKCQTSSDKKLTHAVIEKCLAQKWSGVPADSIGPLLTRVVSVVIDLTTAFDASI